MGWKSDNPQSNLTVEDYIQNGKYCKSGLAFPITEFIGNCSATDRIVYNNTNVTAPYECNPTNQFQRCWLFYNYSAPNDAITLPQRNFSVRCNCALDGNKGYCSNIVGTLEYREAVSKLKTVLEVSECHTLDRDNFRAQRDVCGIGPGNDLDSAIRAMFEMKYHPWVQNGDVRSCIEQVFDDSLMNQQKMQAAPLLNLLGTALALTSLFIVTYL